MSKTSIVLLLLFFIALATLLVLNATYSSNSVLKVFPQIFPTQAVVSENSLALFPQALSAQPGRTTSIQVMIDTKGLKPSLIQLELAYDASIIRHVKILPGTFYQNPEVRLNTVNPRIGRISYAIAPSADKEDKTTSNIVATLQITPHANISKRQTTLKFMPKTVIHTDESKNALSGTTDATIIFASDFVQVASPSAILVPQEGNVLPTAF